MIVIYKYISKTEIRKVTIQENPTPGTWGDYQLMKEELRKNDLTGKLKKSKSERFKQMFFNIRFLKKMRRKYKKLHCVYCGKQGLIVYEFSKTPNKSNMATADHFIPKSLAPHLARDASNLRVCCNPCNSKKGSDLWEENFPYPDKINSPKNKQNGTSSPSRQISDQGFLRSKKVRAKKKSNSE